MRTLVAAVLGLAACAQTASAVIVSFTWTGRGYNSNVEVGENWEGGVAPNLSGGGALLVFGPGRFRDVSFAGLDRDVAGLVVSGDYRFVGNENLLSLFGGGLTVTAPTGKARLEFAPSSLYVDAGADQTWSIATNASVIIGSRLSGGGRISKTGGGTLYLGNDNDSETGAWFGGLVLSQGTVVLGARRDMYEGAVTSGALGTGSVTIGPATGDAVTTPTLVASARENNGDYARFDDDWVIIPNAITVSGSLNTVNEIGLRFTGTVTLATDTVLTSRGENLEFSGPILESGGARKLTVNTSNAVIHFGASGWTGGTEVAQGVFVFAGEDNTPGINGGIVVGAAGYVGISADQNLQGFLDQVAATSTGAIGFDSDQAGGISTFGAGLTIDLSSKDPLLRLGSASRAIIAPDATITPAGGASGPYRFGGGGGELVVAAQLGGARGVTVDSLAQLPLTVRLIHNGNAFTGPVSVKDSALIFGNNGTTGDNVARGVGQLTLVGPGSYIGSEDPDTTPANFLPLFSSTTPGVIGFDRDPGSLTLTPRVVDLTGVGLAGLTQAYLGTASAIDNDGTPGPGLRLTGTIGAGGGGVHRFAAYKGGFLEIAGTLAGSSLVIGHPDALGTFGDRVRQTYSTVLLSGNNGTGLASGTTFHGGQLLLGHANALGAGTLTVAPVNFTIEGEDDEPTPLLGAAAASLAIGNAIHLQTDLNLGGSQAFTLSGVISGSGELYVGEDADAGFMVTLSGANTFGGGVYVSQDSTLIVDHNQALGAGPLAFGQPAGVGSPSVVFNTTAPVVNGLSSGNFASLMVDQDQTVLTINQPTTLEYGDAFRGEIRAEGTAGTMRLVKTGPGTLRLESGMVGEGYNYGLYGYGFGGTALPGNPNVILQVQSGRLVLGDDFYLEDSSSTVWVSGGTLATVNQYLSNPVVVTGGRLAGTGTYFSPVTLGAGAVIAPGFDDAHGRIGHLTISHLTVGPDSVYEFDLAGADPEDYSARDFLSISTDSTLEITATSTDPWVIRPVTLNSSGVNGILGGIAPGATYAWSIAYFQGLSGLALDLDQKPLNVVLDLSAFQPGIAGTTWLHFSTTTIGENTSGTLSLNFTAVPEPSTYALLLLGTGAVVLAARRRRHGR